MSTKLPTGSEKSLDVVFERDTLGSVTPTTDNEETQVERKELSTKEKSLIREMTKQVIRKQIEDLHTEHEKSENREDTKFSHLVKAVEESSAQETSATDKFVNNVENMMKDFHKNLDKLSATCKSILDKLPKADSKISKP